MSAICGIYQSDGKPVLPETAAAMMRELAVYTADAVGTWRKGEVFLGCHAQFVTPESATETLPFHDETAGLTITADAIIDNRKELFDELGIRPSPGVPDGRLILHAYRKWGANCPEHLVGDFAFVVWDEKNRELFCAVEPMGTRTFYYYRSAGVFAFATLMRPLLVLPGMKRKYNETWMADFLSMPCVTHQLDPELTPYEDIYLLPAGHRLTLRAGGAVKQVYWQVERRPVIRLKSDREYEAAFREVLGEAVRCRLRSRRQVGVMMSGGLDSTSVACLAARELAPERLPVFTAVPMAGYRDWTSDRFLPDESPYVEAVRKHAGNIDVVYWRSEGRHPLSDTDRLLARLEQPYKVFENLFWFDDIMAQARERNIGVILHGTAGNATISWGLVRPYLLYLLRSAQWHTLFRESWAAARGMPRPLQVLRSMFIGLLPYGIQKAVYRFTNPSLLRGPLTISPVNPDFARRMSVPNRFRRFDYDPLFIGRMDSFEMRQQMMGPASLSHSAVFITKQSLAHGLALRDPTQDKRVIEFCFRLPESQFVRNGNERFLLRRAMSGLLPDQVRLNISVRGAQSADWPQRLQPSWPAIASEIRSIGNMECERHFLDIGKISNELEKFSTIHDNGVFNPGLRMLVRSLIFSRFLRQEKQFAGGCADSFVKFEDRQAG